MIHLIIFIINLLSVVSIWLLLNEYLKDKLFQFLSLLIIVLQPAFLTQSGLLLVEVPLVGLFFYSIYFFKKNRILLCVTMLSLSLLIKETAILFVLPILALIIFNSYKNFINTKKDFKVTILNLVPLILPASYYLIQFYLKGYLLFPEHTANTSFDESIIDKLSGFGAVCFIYQGRNIILIAFILTISFAIVKKIRLFEKHLFIMLCIMIFYILISSINFFSPRYVLISLVIFTFTSVVFIYNTFIKRRIILYIFFTAILVSISINLVKRKSFNDISPSYVVAANLTKQFINKIETTDSLKGRVEYSFLLHNYRNSTLLGYVDSVYKDSEMEIFYKAFDSHSGSVLNKGREIYKTGILDYSCILVKKD